jgi:mRNA interferase MazF
MVISQGDVVWEDIPEPIGPEAAFRRPVLVVQGDSLNRSGISICVCVPLTSNLAWQDAPGNVLLTRRMTGLAKDSVAQVALIMALDRSLLADHVGRLRRQELTLVLTGIDVVLGK